MKKTSFPDQTLPQCAGHGTLMETLGGILANLDWIKRGMWGTPAILVIILIAFFTYIHNLDARVTACETKLAAKVTK